MKFWLHSAIKKTTNELQFFGLSEEETMVGNIVLTKILEYYVEYFNKQKGRVYPCSNQVVICGVITLDKNKALSTMEEKGAIIRRCSHNYIEWNLNNEIWVWRNWNNNCRGYRFYKTLIDKNISKELFLYVIIYNDIYCCSMEVI